MFAKIRSLLRKPPYKTPEIVAQRVQKQAVKSRHAQRYFTINVVNHPSGGDASNRTTPSAGGDASNRTTPSAVFLIMVGALVAGLIERQVRRVLAKLQQPIQWLMPEGRDTLRPTVERLFKALADYSMIVICVRHACLVQVKNEQGQLIESRFARLNPVQKRILKVLGLPKPNDTKNFTAKK